ncbi:hypothetical protein NQ318_004267 [Aromia moschata]|uniref:protein acetyllysine N-acetyltransferase n=1 Tax=Aromia moschata TaxID=1265417 RepID=A0AAV8XQ92_9CUCU|nr:hypothetical protein NQ318_004267 [Aromia moschata]
MSCSYADGLSPYENKGLLGVPEKFDSDDKVKKNAPYWQSGCKIPNMWWCIPVLASVPLQVYQIFAKIVFSGPNGVWTLEKQGKKPNINVSLNDAIPTKTHMALKHLIEKNYVHFVISQNIDGLHLKTGVPRSRIAELHGNMFIGQCNTCGSQFVRSSATTTVGKKVSGRRLQKDCGKRESL